MRAAWSRSFECAVAGVAAILALMTALPLLIPQSGTDMVNRFTREHVIMLGMVDNSPITKAYRIGLIALLCAGLWFAAARPAIPRSTAFVYLKRYAGIWSIVLGAWLWHSKDLPLNGVDIMVGCLVCVLLSSSAAKTLPIKIVAGTFIAAATVWFLVPGLLHRLWMPSTLLSWVEWHYSASLTQGDRLASGLTLGRDVHLTYGLLLPTLLGSYERAFGMLDFGAHIRLVQWTQVAYLLTALAALYLWRRNVWFVLFGLLLIGPFASTSHVAVLFPNQSGWRSLGFPLGIIALLLLGRLPLLTMTLSLGFMAGLLLLLNPETGVAITIGYVLFVLSRCRSAREASVMAAAGAASAIAAGGLTAALFFVGLGYWPPLTPHLLLSLVSKFGSGYGSLHMDFSPLALMMFVHSAFIVLLFCLRWKQKLTFEQSMRLAMAATILVWMPYYINRPDVWDLWTYLLPYCLLIAHWFEVRRLTLRRLGCLRGVAGARMAAICLVLVPFAMTPKKTMSAPDGSPSTVISGVAFPTATACDLKARATFLSSQPKGTIFLSHNSYSLSLLTGRFNALPMQDVFAETTTPRELRDLTAQIEQSPFDVLLFDSYEPNPYYYRFYRRLKTHLTQFEQHGERDGWQIWRRVRRQPT